MTIFKYAVLRGFRSPISIILNLVLPIALIFVRPIWVGQNVTGFYYMAMVLMYGSFLMARGMLSDRIDNTIVRILAAPVTTAGYLTQNLLACMFPITVQIGAVCAIGAALYQWSLDLSILLALCYTVFASACVAFSFAWSCLFKNKETSYAIFSVLMSVIAIISGFWIPLSILPQPIRFVAALFPAYWTSNGVDALLTGGMSGEYWLSIAVVLFFAIAYLLYGAKRKIV